jgi:hypothetical protein
MIKQSTAHSKPTYFSKQANRELNKFIRDAIRTWMHPEVPKYLIGESLLRYIERETIRLRLPRKEVWESLLKEALHKHKRFIGA